MHISLIFMTAIDELLPFGFEVGDELVPPADDGTSRPVSLSCQFYGVEEDTVYVRIFLFTPSHTYTYSINA